MHEKQSNKELKFYDENYFKNSRKYFCENLKHIQKSLLLFPVPVRKYARLLSRPFYNFVLPEAQIRSLHSVINTVLYAFIVFLIIRYCFSLCLHLDDAQATVHLVVLSKN